VNHDHIIHEYKGFDEEQPLLLDGHGDLAGSIPVAGPAPVADGRIGDPGCGESLPVKSGVGGFHVFLIAVAAFVIGFVVPVIAAHRKIKAQDAAIDRAIQIIGELDSQKEAMVRRLNMLIPRLERAEYAAEHLERENEGLRRECQAIYDRYRTSY
jgi:hypothetical protein